MTSAASTRTQSQFCNPSTRGARDGSLERADQPFGDRSDMNVGAAGRDDHGVGERGFAVQVDGNDVLGFGIIEAGQDSLHELTGVGS